MKTMLVNQKMEPRLHLTIPNLDWHFVKHLVDMQPTGRECKSEHKGLETYLRFNNKGLYILTLVVIKPITSCIHYLFNYEWKHEKSHD